MKSRESKPEKKMSWLRLQRYLLVRINMFRLTQLSFFYISKNVCFPPLFVKVKGQVNCQADGAGVAIFTFGPDENTTKIVLTKLNINLSYLVFNFSNLTFLINI